MSRKTSFLAAILVLLLGVAAVAIVRMGNDDNNGDETASTPPARDGSANSASRFTGDANSGTERISKRSEREVRNEELVEQYGEARTNLARHVSDNVVSLLDDAIQMGEMMTSGQSNFGGGNWAIRGILRNAGVELTDEQREQASELYKDYQKRELEKTKKAVEQLRTDPTSLMSMVLAGDAKSRGDLGEEEYASLQAANAEALGDIINPLDRNNFRGGSPMEDEAFRSGFESLLDPEQAETFNAKMAENEASDSGRQQTDITQMPTMDLESLDQAVSSAKQMTTGVRSMMEGMNGLRELQPLMEQQNNPEGE
ncbi:hypothetical protein [Haloferula rosea]|uniref:Uncharacterized protein n=1 Tax=Haloferula rosea TaxID=490093 RepID=A0A934VAJ1_9BACT|nr:hypothetical protein [Haloferula rosea]MBK1826353.1 hypothetical protein [Haloferula rosea]